MGDWWKGIAKLLGYEVEEVPDERITSEQTEPIVSNSRMRKNNIVTLHQANIGKVILLKPTSFDKVQDIADHLKNNTAVVVNLDEIDKEIAVRILDFLSGTVYAIKGKIQKVSTNIFLLAPSNYQVLDSECDLEHKNKVRFAERIWDRKTISLKEEKNG